MSNGQRNEELDQLSNHNRDHFSIKSFSVFHFTKKVPLFFIIRKVNLQEITEEKGKVHWTISLKILRATEIKSGMSMDLSK